MSCSSAVSEYIKKYFISLQLGIVTALIWANVDYSSYEYVASDSAHYGPVINDHATGNLFFWVNDVYMVLFFGSAMVHVTLACLPGGQLRPLHKALSTLAGTAGGVIVPATLYIGLCVATGTYNTAKQGWAVCIATDISIAWLGSSIVFGAEHAAVKFLLLLSVADDVVGLLVIAIVFPSAPLNPAYLFSMVPAAMILALVLRNVVRPRLEATYTSETHWVRKYFWVLYVLICGPLSWCGLFYGGLHTSLALCFVIPLFNKEDLTAFEHQTTLYIQLGLFLFGLVNTGVPLTSVGYVTLNVAVAQVVGKFVGISAFTSCFAWLYNRKAVSLPGSMSFGDLVKTASIACAGLTVSIFVSNLAFQDSELRAEAKVGALISTLVVPIVIVSDRVAKSRT